MGYRKLKADYLFTGSSLLQDGEVLVTTSHGEIVSIINGADAGDDVEVFKGIISPGFVNAHCHLELSHMKGLIPEKTGLVDFVYRVMNERQFSKIEIAEAIDKAELEMRQSGIVAVGDICNTTLTLAQKSRHHLLYYNFIEASGWAPSLSASRWESVKNCYEEYANKGFTASLVPHAPYSVSDSLWEKLHPYFGGKTISLHNQESTSENELFLTGTGDLLRLYKNLGIDNSFFLPSSKTSLQTCFPKLSDAASLILVHNTFITQADVNYIVQSARAHQCVSFCICPNANLYIEATLPPVDMLVKNNCLMVLGTDSLASNRSLSIVEEMKTIQQNFSFLSLESLLRWGTLNGAKALQLDNMLGSFEKGKVPGVILIDNMDGQKFRKESASKRIL